MIPLLFLIAAVLVKKSEDVNKMKKVIVIILVIILGVFRSELICQAASSDEVPKELNSLYARGAVLMDGDTGRILYGKNENEKMPMASTTKIMTCILTLENGELDSVVTVSSNAAVQPAVKLGMNTGEQFYLKDLLYSLMLESFNDSAVAIAEHIGGSVEGFADLMNAKAKEIGCDDTYFITPNGLDGTDEKGTHSTTAANLARIMKYCIKESPKREEFLEITRTALHSFQNVTGNRTFSCVNHNAFLSMMEGALSGKTGFTGNAGYCYVGALKRDGKTFIVALLACGWPNNKSYKWSDTRKLMEYGLKNYDYRKIRIGNEPGVFVTADILKPIEVINGIPDSKNLSDKSYVNAYLNCSKDDEIKILLREDEKITAKYELHDQLKAPVKAKTEVGKVSYYLGDKLLREYPIITNRGVNKLGINWCIEQIWERFIA